MPAQVSLAGQRPGIAGQPSGALADLGETIEPLEGHLAGLDRQRLRAAIGAEAFEAEYATGRALTPEESLVLALGEPP